MRVPAQLLALADAAQEHHRAGGTLLLCLDYDGTLTPIVAHPDLAVLDTTLRDTLQALSWIERVDVGVISGRALDNLRERIGLSSLWYAGSAGLEIAIGEQRLDCPVPDGMHDDFHRLPAEFASVLLRYPGAWLEPKPLALAIHFRAVDPTAVPDFLTACERLLQSYPQLESRIVSCALEVTPRGGWHKGDAVAQFHQQSRLIHPAPVLPIYCGDAPNDLEGMETTRRFGGFVIGVGDDVPTIVEHRIETPDILAAWLTHLRERLNPY